MGQKDCVILPQLLSPIGFTTGTANFLENVGYHGLLSKQVVAFTGSLCELLMKSYEGLGTPVSIV